MRLVARCIMKTERYCPHEIAQALGALEAVVLDALTRAALSTELSLDHERRVDGFIVRGVVRSPASRSARDVDVVVSLFARDGELVADGRARLQAGDSQGKGTASFQVHARGIGGRPLQNRLQTPGSTVSTRRQTA